MSIRDRGVLRAPPELPGNCRVLPRSAQVLEHVKRRQKEYFIRLTQGDYGRDYVDDRLRLASVHEKIGLPVVFLGMYSLYFREIATRLLDAYAGDPRGHSMPSTR